MIYILIQISTDFSILWNCFGYLHKVIWTLFSLWVV